MVTTEVGMEDMVVSVEAMAGDTVAMEGMGEAMEVIIKDIHQWDNLCIQGGMAGDTVALAVMAEAMEEDMAEGMEGTVEVLVATID